METACERKSDRSIYLEGKLFLDMLDLYVYDGGHREWIIPVSGTTRDVLERIK
jgi:hypothetical protein